MKQGKSKVEKYGTMKYLKPILTGTLVGAVVITIILMVLSLLLSLQNIPQMLITPMVLLALAVGSLMGGNFAAKLVREKGLAVGLCCGVLLFLMLLLFGQGISDNGFGIMAAAKLAIALAFSAIGGVMGVNTKKRRK
ncbi:TIGR04086 family membrane protein [Hydrogenoanaerobacterium sp.]|uniref:TIGR04086 family membrane protein n=1 Tax=Hydrogenoanaerobacterium sp. TaxID=2953763 RepID=UPI0028A259A0|nr:TIGR04086 family membrane protein [Hydrogenoanaerobacterium sp.]